MRVVDTHFHWYPRTLLETMTQRTSYPRAERAGEGYRCVLDEARHTIPLPGVWFDLDAGLAVAASATGADTSVIATSGVLSGLLEGLPTEEAVAAATAYNRALAEQQHHLTGQFFGTAMVPLQDTDAALSVLDEAVLDLDLRGVNLPAVAGQSTVDDPRLEPFYARVAELGAPLIVHPTDFVFADTLAGYQDGLQRSLGRLLDSSVTVLRLVFSGVLERHPGVRVVQTHAGGLLPYQAGRIDKNARIAGLPRAPSEYLTSMFVDTVAPQALTIRTALEFYGARHMLYGTDHPCWSPRAAVEVIHESGMDEDTRELVLCENARLVFRLD